MFVVLRGKLRVNRRTAPEDNLFLRHVSRYDATRPRSRLRNGVGLTWIARSCRNRFDPDPLTVEFDPEIGTRLGRNQLMMACIQENITQVHLPEALVGVHWEVLHEIRIGIGMKASPQPIAVLTTPRRLVTRRRAKISVFPGRH